MSTDVRIKIAKARQMTSAIHEEIVNAIALQAIWSRCASERNILKRMNDTYEGAAFAMIRDALHMNLVQALMRLYDHDKRTSSIVRVLEILQEPNVVQHLKSEKWADVIDIDAELHKIEGNRRDADHLGCLTALKNLRDQYIAHRDFDPSPHGAKYGQELRLLEQTISIIQHIETILTGLPRDEDYSYFKTYHTSCADDFWTHVAAPSRMADDKAVD